MYALADWLDAPRVARIASQVLDVVGHDLSERRDGLASLDVWAGETVDVSGRSRF